MNDITGTGQNRWTWQVGPAFIAIVLQAVVAIFMMGGIWYRIDTSFSKIDSLTVKIDTVQQSANDKLTRFEIFMAKVQASYDSIKERLARVENKIDQTQPRQP